MPVREPCLGFDLARPCPPVASLRLCALGTSARLHRRITALSPSRDHPWPNSGAPSLHFWRSVADRSSTSPCTATVPHDAATFADVHCCYLSGRPYRRFPISRSSPRLAWPGLVPPTFNQINLACRFRPRARALSLSQLRSAAAHLRRPPFRPTPVATLIDWHLSPSLRSTSPSRVLVVRHLHCHCHQSHLHFPPRLAPFWITTTSPSPRPSPSNCTTIVPTIPREAAIRSNTALSLSAASIFASLPTTSFDQRRSLAFSRTSVLPIDRTTPPPPRPMFAAARALFKSGVALCQHPTTSSWHASDSLSSRRTL